MPSRDVEINLIGNDRTGRATRSAANNLDQLARKVDKFNAKTVGGKDAKVNVDNASVANLQKTFAKAGDRAGTSFVSRFRGKLKTISEKIKVKVDVDRSQVSQLETIGRRFGNAIANAMGNAISDGTRAIGNAVKNVLLNNPQLQPIALGFAALLVAHIGQAVTAVAALLGPALLAAPIAFLLIQQGKAMEEIEKSENRIAALRKRLSVATNKDTQERLRKEIAAEERILAEQEKRAQSLNRLKDRAKAFMEFISRPIRVPLEKALDEIGDGLERLKGPMRDITAALGPALAPFTKGVMDGLLAFINALQPALPGIVAGMQAWGDAMPRIGKAVGDIFAKILQDPEAVKAAISGFVGVFEDLAASAANLVSALTEVANAYGKVATAIDVFENKNFASGANAAAQTEALRRPWQRVWRAMVSDAQGAVVAVLSAFDNLFSGIPAIPGSAFDKFKTGLHNALVAAQADMEATDRKWAETDASISAKEIEANIKANNADIEAKIARSKALLDTVKDKKVRARIEANIADLELKLSIGKSLLIKTAKQKTKPKVEARIDDLQAKVKAGRKALKTVDDSKTRAKIKADIKAALAEIARLKGLLRSIPDETVKINVVTTRRTIVTGPVKMGRGRDVAGSAGVSWQAALAGGAMSRTEPPRVSVESPTVSTRVFLDSREIAAVVRSTVNDENRKAATRARIGRRN